VRGADAGAGVGGAAAGATGPPLEEEDHRFLQQQPRVLTTEERDAIRELAADIPAWWNAPTTTAMDRKDILRQVRERVEVETRGQTEPVRIRITWAGGGQTEHGLVRPLARDQDRSDDADWCARVRDLTDAGWSLDAMASQLGQEGYPPLRRTRAPGAGVGGCADPATPVGTGHDASAWAST
jgi:hypothetical protein